MKDSDLLIRLISILRRHVEDQRSNTPRHKLEDVPSEIHGELADLLFIDKIENQMLVAFLIEMLTERERTNEEIGVLLDDILMCLEAMRRDRLDIV